MKITAAYSNADQGIHTAIYYVAWYSHGGHVKLGDEFFWGTSPDDYKCEQTIRSTCTVTTEGVHI